MRAVALFGLVSIALVGIVATSPISASADDLDSARSRLSELRNDLETVVDRYIEARDELVQLNQMMDVRNGQIERRAKRLLGFQKDAEAVAIELYKGGGSVGAIEGMLSSETMADLNRTTAYLEFSGEDQQRVIERVQKDTQELEHELDLLDKQREQAQATLDELADIQATVEADAAEVQQQVEGLELEAARAAELQAEREAAEAAAQAATQTIFDNPPPSSAPVPSPSSEADWEAIAMCESGGNWHIDSTYDGGLQFHPNTWLAYGGGRYARYAWQATKEQQIAIAEKVLAGQGPGAWPNCFQWK
jgi:peptidoglycan hydrolase CwlO-like protein